MTCTVTVNGESRRSAAATLADLVRELGLQPEKVAVERNGEIVPRSTLADQARKEALRNATDEPSDEPPTPPWMRT